MPRPTKDAPLYGGKPINKAISADLNLAVSGLPPDEAAAWKQRVTQGWHLGTSASKGTHDWGYAIDWLTADMPDEAITRLVRGLQDHAFAAALRPVGYDLGGGNLVRTEHIHAAHRGRNPRTLREYSNYSAVRSATQKGGPAELAKMLKRRKP